MRVSSCCELAFSGQLSAISPRQSKDRRQVASNFHPLKKRFSRKAQQPEIIAQDGVVNRDNLLPPAKQVPHSEKASLPEGHAASVILARCDFTDSRHYEKPFARSVAVSGYYSNRGTEHEIPGEI